MNAPLKPRRDGRAHARRSILVVEDEKLTRWSISEALREEYRVHVAATAEQALKLVGRLKRLDGVLVDIRLPGMDGLEFVRRARTERPDLKVFVMTAYNQETTARDAFGVRADGYLTKPFDLRMLRDMLDSRLLREKH